MDKIEFTLNAESLFDLINDLATLPETWSIKTVEKQLTLNIKVENRELVMAQLQEKLRERFSHPERVQRNQLIIKHHLKEF